MFIEKTNKFTLDIFTLEYPECLPEQLLRFANNTLYFKYGVTRTKLLEKRCEKFGVVLNVKKYKKEWNYFQNSN
jgi:hypothetical protein